jgi:hypothetical protein
VVIVLPIGVVRGQERAQAFGVSDVVASFFGVFPASDQLGVGGFAAHPEIGPSWKVRGAIVILLPRRQ